MRCHALEGSGDLRAALLKNGGAHDDEKPQGGQKGEGAESCNHRIDPSSERQTELDMICSSLSRAALVRRCNVPLLFLCVKSTVDGGEQALESTGCFG